LPGFDELYIAIGQHNILAASVVIETVFVPQLLAKFHSFEFSAVFGAGVCVDTFKYWV
jgi:hypothetical protein